MKTQIVVIYVCRYSGCGKTFYRGSELNRHQRDKHGGQLNIAGGSDVEARLIAGSSDVEARPIAGSSDVEARLMAGSSDVDSIGSSAE